MICNHCGNQLPEGTRFCVFCGNAQESQPVAAPAPVEETPVVPVEETPVVPVEETPVAPVEEPQASLAEDSFLNAVAVEEATYETPFAAPELNPARTSAPKKKSKVGAIIAIILVVVLLAGAAVGVYLWLNQKQKTAAYEDAIAMLEAGDVNGALSAFEDLGDYEDSAEMVENLEKYQQAMKKLEAHEYEEALAIFKKLGKFHDSKTYVESGVDYHEANYLMTCAESEGSVELYYDAAEMFEELGDYQDAVKLRSSCLLQAGLKELALGDEQAAIDLLEDGALSEEDAAALKTAIESASADAAMLVSMEYALQLWLDAEENYTRGDELEKAYEAMASYEDMFFLDSRLEALYGDFMASLETQMEAMDSDEEVGDWVKMYEGMAEMYKVCETLYDEYGFLKGSDLESSFIGGYEIVSQYATIEKSLTKQLVGVNAPEDEENGYYAITYTNDTGIDFTLSIVIDFYMDDEHLETGDELQIEVPAGAAVQIPLLPKTLDKLSGFNGWVPDWLFEIK